VSYALASRVRALEQAALPRTSGADIRTFLRDSSAAPPHARGLVSRWRRFAAAAEADGGGDLDEVLSRLLEAGFAVDDDMIETAAARLGASEAAAPIGRPARSGSASGASRI
jgi:hypothetical protein